MKHLLRRNRTAVAYQFRNNGECDFRHFCGLSGPGSVPWHAAHFSGVGL
jgi:hypothetical protein